MSPKRIRVVLADDHPIFRLGVAALLADQADMELVTEAETGEGALAAVAKVAPDVLLLDLNLPDINGLEVLKRLRGQTPGPHTVLLTAGVDPDQMRQALQHGAHGILLKHTASDLLPGCIRQVARGEYFVGPGELTTLVDALRAPHAAMPVLTARELEVVQGVVSGAPNKAIASDLNIGEQTVKNHLRNIFDKLGISNRVELALLAVKRGLVARPRRD